ncbi:MAG: RNA polymerase sigma factor SigF [Oscillatoriales cyanobacterium]|nr:MAG: RNA polymerase sigma factor SigF [Oscillatoriales cyanobacterium]
MAARSACVASNDLRARSLELLTAYRASPSTDLRNRLVELNFGLVKKEAAHWVAQCQESYEDLLQIGSIGLIRAIERFDATKGNAFSSFALPYIRGEIQHYLRDRSGSIRIPRRWLELQQQAATMTRTLRVELSRQPTEAEVATALGIELSEWQHVELARQNRSLLSLDAPIRSDDDEPACLGETLPDRKYRSFQLAEEDRLRLNQALVKLEERTRQILEFVFLHDLTQKEVADRMGISAVTVSRRVRKGLESLKDLMDMPED